MKKNTRIGGKVAVSGQQKKLRVAAYCRVSTDSDAQLESLAAQKAHYEQYISAHPEWELVEIYYDEGISGTRKEKRPELLRLLADCEAGRIDYIVTKSISRFARNTTDSLEMVRKLKKHGIPVYFEKENINTGDMEGELLLTIMSGMAEGESASISENAKWSVVQRFKNETYKLVNPPYGYDWDGKNLAINEEQAKHVRWIFAQTLAGVPLTRIAREMNDKGLRTCRGNAWQAETLRSMIINERYVGDVLLQKKYTDFRYNRHRNRGEVPQFLWKDHHPAIVSREDFEAVEAMMERHRQERGIEIQREKYQSRYSFSGKLICGNCGKAFKRRMQNGYVAWWCSSHIRDHASCSMKYIREDAIREAFVLMLNKLTFGCKAILRPYYSSLREELDQHKVDKNSQEDLQEALSENKGKQDILAHLATQGLIDEALLEQERSSLSMEARGIRRKLYLGMNDPLKNNEMLRATRELVRLAESKIYFEKFDEDLFEKHVDHILVEARGRIAFVMKCGLELREKLNVIDGRRTAGCTATESKMEDQP